MSGVAPPKKVNVGSSKKRTLENNGANPKKRSAEDGMRIEFMVNGPSLTKVVRDIPMNEKTRTAFDSRFTIPSKNVMGTTRSNTGTIPYIPTFGKGGRRRRATRKRRVSRKRMTRRR
jgi:hypothetical protein